MQLCLLRRVLYTLAHGAGQGALPSHAAHGQRPRPFFRDLYHHPHPRLQAWAEYAWLRLRRMDYWNPAHIPTNASNKLFRHHAPGAFVGAKVMRHDEAKGTSDFSVRYFHRDQMRRDTGYYPDTPLSLSHSLMKAPHSQGLRPPAEPPSKLPNPPTFALGGATTAYGTPATMGIKGKNSRDAWGGVPGVPTY